MANIIMDYEKVSSLSNFLNSNSEELNTIYKNIETIIGTMPEGYQGKTAKDIANRITLYLYKIKPFVNTYKNYSSKVSKSVTSFKGIEDKYSEMLSNLS